MKNTKTPRVNLEATLIARYPEKMRATRKSTLTVIQYVQKTSNGMVW
jgi:hypothetical protein